MLFKIYISSLVYNSCYLDLIAALLKFFTSNLALVPYILLLALGSCI